MDLLLDAKDFFLVRLQRGVNKSLLAQGFRVENRCCLLGAHVQTTRKHTNDRQMSRVHAIQPLSSKLSLSASSYATKVRALTSAAWPKGLHAIAATNVSLQTFVTLRASAIKGLNDGSGVSSFVHLGLTECPTASPHFWSVQQTLRLARDCGIEEVVMPALVQLSHGTSTHAANGISAALMTRIQSLGWHVSRNAAIVNTCGEFSLFGSCMEELARRMEYAWLKHADSQASHRTGFWDLDRVDPSAFRKLLNAARITQDGKNYCQETDSDVCVYCDCSA